MGNEHYKEYYRRFKDYIKESYIWTDRSGIDVYKNRWQISHLLTTLKVLSSFDKLYDIYFFIREDESIVLSLNSEDSKNANFLSFDTEYKTLDYAFVGDSADKVFSIYVNEKDISNESIRLMLVRFTNNGKPEDGK